MECIQAFTPPFLPEDSVEYFGECQQPRGVQYLRFPSLRIAANVDADHPHLQYAPDDLANHE